MDSHEMLPSVQSDPSSWTISLINIYLKLKSKEGAYKLFKSLHKAGLIFQLLLKLTQYNNYLYFSSNTTFPVTKKGGNHNFQHHQSFTASVTISPYNLSSHFAISEISVRWTDKKTSTSRRGYRGPTQLYMWVVWFIVIVKWTMYTIKPPWKSPFTSL